MKQYSPAEARALLLRAREQNHPGWGGGAKAPPYSFYHNGLLKEQFLRAAETLAGPAFQDDPIASYTLGKLYDLGWGGVKKDVEAAESWFKKSAGAGYAKAMLSLGHLYHKKKPYEHRSDYLNNQSQSIRWYEQAALHGEEWGHFYVAEMVMYDFFGEKTGPGRNASWTAFRSYFLKSDAFDVKSPKTNTSCPRLVRITRRIAYTASWRN